MKHEILEADGIRVDLEHRILTRYAALQRVMQATQGPRTPRGGYSLSEQVGAAGLLSEALGGKLGNPDLTEVMGGHAAELIVIDLTERAERGTSAFWASPLGRACGWWTGGIVTGSMPEDSVPLAIVGAIVGMSRQSVHEARNKGRFGDSTTAISPEAVRAWMRRTYPLVTS